MMLTKLGVAAPVVAAAVAVAAVVVDGVAVVVAVVGLVVALAAAKLFAPQLVPQRMEECSVVRRSDCTPTPVLAEGGRSPGCSGHVLWEVVEQRVMQGKASTAPETRPLRIPLSTLLVVGWCPLHVPGWEFLPRGVAVRGTWPG